MKSLGLVFTFVIITLALFFIFSAIPCLWGANYHVIIHCEDWEGSGLFISACISCFACYEIWRKPFDWL